MPLPSPLTFTGGDPYQQTAFAPLATGTTTISVTHDVNRAALESQRILALVDGVNRLRARSEGVSTLLVVPQASGAVGR